MTEPQISPLARRLAEENSIDWRVIPGTGPESRVIERDILTYLARIMSGEIDPPALADASEPPAPGGAVPNLADVSNLAAASAGMAKEGIDLSSLLGGSVGSTTPVVSSFAAAEIAAPVFSPPEPIYFAPTQSDPPIQTEPVIHAEPLSSSPPEFTFSDAPALVAAPSSPSLEQISFGEATAFGGQASFDEPAAFAEPMTPPPKLSPADSIDAEFEIDLDDFDDAVLLQSSAVAMPVMELTAAETELPAELPIMHQEDLVLDIEPASEAALTVAKTDATNEIDDDLVLADITTEPAIVVAAPAYDLEPVAFEAHPEPVLEALEPEPIQLEPMVDAVELEPMRFQPAAPALDIADLQDDDFEFDLIDTDTIVVDSALPATPEETVPEPSLSDPTLEPAVTADAGELFDAAPPLEAVEAVTEPELVASEPVLPEAPLLETPLPYAMANLVQSAEPEPQPITPAVVTPPSAAEPEPQPITPAVVTPPSAIAPGFFAGFAVRRHFDASALTKMQHELAQALNGREVPLAVFLARAAQRNLHTLGRNDVVTLTRLGDTLEPLSASGLHHSFIEAVQSVARATPGSAQGLLVLDISHLGADDLAFHSTQPMLSLNVKGDHGYLALAGDLPASKAADFLAHVAQALEIPVSLVI